MTCGVTKISWNKFHERTLSIVFCCYYFFSGIAIQLEKVGPTFSSLSPCPSLPSVKTGERRRFQCLNIVLNSKTGPLFLKCNYCEKNFSFLIAKSVKLLLKKKTTNTIDEQMLEYSTTTPLTVGIIIRVWETARLPLP